MFKERMSGVGVRNNTSLTSVMVVIWVTEVNKHTQTKAVLN